MKQKIKAWAIVLDGFIMMRAFQLLVFDSQIIAKREVSKLSNGYKIVPVTITVEVGKKGR